ncbi:MAG: BCCT family transporter [Caulobacteraceae bacterium]
MENVKTKAKIRKAIFYPMSIIFVAAIILGVVAPEAFFNGNSAIMSFAFKNFGWLFQITSVLFLGVCVFFFFSKYGDIKFGGKDAQPTLSYWNWFAITLCAGIATGILFWGTAEPLMHFTSPPAELGIAPNSEASAVFAMETVFIHWTFIPYAMYAIAGLGIAYAIYNMKLPFQVSSTLYPIFGKRIKGSVGAIVDNLCLFAMFGGVAAVLGVGTLQIAIGLNKLAGVPKGKGTWIAIVSVMVVIFLISSYSGLNKGIRWLSDKNSKIFLGIMAFVFIFGPTTFILSLGTQGFGNFLNNFFMRTQYLSPVDGGQWPQWWPIVYWAFWLAYAPLEGMFFALLCKGRTIRQFLLVNLVAPSIFGVLWFSIFGGAAIYGQIHGQGLMEAIQANGFEISIFKFLEAYPAGALISWVIIVTVILSIVTLCDSMTSTIASLSTTAYDDPTQEAPGKIKIFWGFAMASMAIINLLCAGGKISGIDATKQLATVAGFPILFFMILLTYGTIKMIVNQEKYDLAYYPETAHIDPEVLVVESTEKEAASTTEGK